MALPSISTKNSAINEVDSQIAAELAFEISPVEEILARHGLTSEDLIRKLSAEPFRQMVKQAKRVWKSDLSVKERIRLKSMVLVEDSLLELYSIFHDKDMHATARLEAFKSLSKVATTDVPDKDGASVGEKVSITINIPGIERPLNIEATSLIEVTHERETFADGA